MIKILNIRLGFATNSSSSHSIVFFSDENFFKNLEQTYPFCDSIIYNKLYSSIDFSNTNFVIKNKNLIKIYILSQLANSIFSILKNNELTYKIVRDLTGEDLESLIREEFIVDENSSEDFGDFCDDGDYGNDDLDDDELENFPCIDHNSIWLTFNELISLNYNKTTGTYNLEIDENFKIFIKKLLDAIADKNIALINNYEERFLDPNLFKKYHIERDEDLKKYIDVEKTKTLKEILEEMPKYYYSYARKKTEKNIKIKCDGNNKFTFFNKKTGTKVRFSFEENVNYEKSITPELVDIKITDYCPFGCKFCYMGSTTKGKHADLNTVKEILNLLSNLNVFEVALGGGEPTLHPNISEIIEYGHAKDLAVNITTYNSKIFNNKKLLKQFVDRKISSVGFSINKIEDVDKLLGLINVVENCINKNKNKFFIVRDYLIAHIVLGAHDYETFYKMIEKCLENNIRILFLGPKHVGFGKEYKFYDIGKQMQYIWLRYDNSKYNGNSNVKIKMFSIDTKFIQLSKLDDFKKYFDIRKINSTLITPEEGKFSMYIDCVEKLMAPSSYCERGEMDKLELNREKFLENWRKY